MKFEGNQLQLREECAVSIESNNCKDIYTAYMDTFLEQNLTKHWKQI